MRKYGYWPGDRWEDEEDEGERERVEKIIEEAFSGDLVPRPTSTYVVYLPPLAKALLEETNRKYMFYEFICNHTRVLTHRLRPDRGRVWVTIPAWFYEMARQEGFNSVGIYLLANAWMGFFNLEPSSSVPSVSVRVYKPFRKLFGDPLFPELYRAKIEEIVSRWWKRPHKVFDSTHRLARRLRYVKQRYRLTRTNTMLLYLAFFLRFVKDKMVRE